MIWSSGYKDDALRFVVNDFKVWVKDVPSF